MKKAYDIWVEGYSTTGQSAPARIIGRAHGSTFKKACVQLAQKDIIFRDFYNEKQNTYWVASFMIMKSMLEGVLDEESGSV